MKITLLILLIAASTTLAFTPDPGAVIVFSDSPDYSSGQTFAEGSRIRNDNGETAVLLSTGSLIVLPPKTNLRVPVGMKPKAWYFNYTLNALNGLDSKWNNLKIDLDKRFAGVAFVALPDTVEGRLVYPIGATVVEIPDAIKWNLKEKPVEVEIRENTGMETVLSLETRGDSILRPVYVDNIQPETIYSWRVITDSRIDSTWFSLLPENDLLELSDQFSVFERVEELDKSPEIKFGWLMLRVAVLVQRNLYYEARAQIRKFREDNPKTDPRVEQLIYKVRMIQRYGLPPESKLP